MPLLRRRAIRRAPDQGADIFGLVMVPDAIAALLSHGRTAHGRPADPADAISGRIACAPGSSDGIGGGSLGLRAAADLSIAALAELADPLAVFSETETALSLEGMRAAMATVSKPALGALRKGGVAAGRQQRQSGPPRRDR